MYLQSTCVSKKEQALGQWEETPSLSNSMLVASSPLGMGMKYKHSMFLLPAPPSFAKLQVWQACPMSCGMCTNHDKVHGGNSTTVVENSHLDGTASQGRVVRFEDLPQLIK